MPKTAKVKTKNKNIVKLCNASKHITRNQQNYVRKEDRIKKELVVNSPKATVIEEVFHRKSERRRVARDIFLVFEDDKNSRRKTRSNKKQTLSKFGHLRVENPIRQKGLLRDIKNDKKCYLSGNSISANGVLHTDAPIKRKNDRHVKSEKNVAPVFRTENSSSHKINKVSSLEAQPCTFESEPNFVARVNPIFLWVKQDNTRIVEVRCEDYDKRNRIRITKTSNGWRAIPRSDATTSRVIKFNPTPLMKVKKENIHEAKICNKSDIKDVACKDFLIPNIFPGYVPNEIDTKLHDIDTVCNPVAIKNLESKTKKKSKKKSHSENFLKNTKNTTAALKRIVNTESVPTLLNRSFNTNSSVVLDFPVQISGRTESISKELMSENGMHTKINLVQNFEKNTGDLEIDTTSTNSSLPLNKISTYQKESEKEFFHLCPKTGLFLSNLLSISAYENDSKDKIDEENASRTNKNCFLSFSKEELNSDIEKFNLESKIQITEENTESLEAKTRNLKDLLDDADLLQNCDYSANSDADLIDTIVKTSCENNLIQANEIITKVNMDQMNQKTLHGVNEMVVQLIADVSDPPKCLSFNEAGEIEGLNGELFQSNTYIEAFDKQSSAMLTAPHVFLHSTTSVVGTTTLQKTSCENIEPIVGDMDKDNSNLPSVNENEDSPKDLSYKKREEVYPPSDSRSQCAVTSSSDVIKSSEREETSLASSSEMLKNLILDQFLKFNVLTTQNQRESLHLEEQIHSDISNMKSVYSSKPAQCNNFIENDENGSDIEHEEPLKKRLRLNKHNVLTQNMMKLPMIDKDPDPLTQLRLLIRNTEWKVPDPILVPKDRLSAVLASPAREIPLLITTRPELRLPEAFAYPEIIQNPNILVISMAQLEAILKKELEVEKRTSLKVVKPVVNRPLSVDQIDAQLPSPGKHLQLKPKHPQKFLSSRNNSKTANNRSKSQTDLSDSSFERSHEHEEIPLIEPALSDIDSASMAVLNQMLWLPYFGKLSRDIEKSIKNPMRLQEKYSNIFPFSNSHRSSLTNFDEILKNVANSKMACKSFSNSSFESFQQQSKAHEDLSIFQKIVQHQMQSVLKLNQLKADPSQVMPSVAAETLSSIDISKYKIESPNLSQQGNQKVFSNKEKNTSTCTNQATNCTNNILVQDKCYNLRSTVAGRRSVESKQYPNYNKRQIIDKPRLTCKSLSNLLDPEHSMLLPSSSSIPLVKNLSSDFLKNINDMKRSSRECGANPSNAEGKIQFVCNATIVPPSHKSCSNMNTSIDTSTELHQQNFKSQANRHSNNKVPVLTVDTNAPLWHPLFGRKMAIN